MGRVKTQNPIPNATRPGFSTGQTKNPGIAHEYYRGSLHPVGYTWGLILCRGIIFKCGGKIGYLHLKFLNTTTPAHEKPSCVVSTSYSATPHYCKLNLSTISIAFAPSREAITCICRDERNRTSPLWSKTRCTNRYTTSLGAQQIVWARTLKSPVRYSSASCCDIGRSWTCDLLITTCNTLKHFQVLSSQRN